jgi:hypothetical protein
MLILRAKVIFFLAESAESKKKMYLCAQID